MIPVTMTLGSVASIRVERGSNTMADSLLTIYTAFPNAIIIDCIPYAVNKVATTYITGDAPVSIQFHPSINLRS